MTTAPDRRIHRRTLTTAAAWTIPAVAVATAAPFAAASTHPVPPKHLVISPADCTEIKTWKGDHHYGSANKDEKRRSYDFPVFVTDGEGNPVTDAIVTVVATGKNHDGDLLGVYTYPAPSNGGPESHPHPLASVSAGPAGRYLFAVNTQNLSAHERGAKATLTITAKTPTATATSRVYVFLKTSD